MRIARLVPLIFTLLVAAAAARAEVQPQRFVVPLSRPGQPVRLEVSLVSERADKGRYRVKSDWQEGIRIGAGGPLLSFDTVNGNIYLRQRG